MTADDFAAIRKSMGLKQAELGALMGVTQATISRWETGSLPIDMRTATTLRTLAVQRTAA